MSTVQEARSRIMTLSASERASLAHELILSLDDPRDAQVWIIAIAHCNRRTGYWNERNLP